MEAQINASAASRDTLMRTTRIPTETNNAPTSASVTAGLVTRPEIAADLHRSERTVVRFEHAGMPVIRIGNARLYDPVSVRAWLMSHEHRHDAPKRGRPAKQAA